MPELATGSPVHNYGELPRVDYYNYDDMLTPAERDIRDRVRAFVDAEVSPIINSYYEAAEFPFFLIEKFKALNIAGGPLMGYGCPGMSFLASGLMAAELARGDGSMCTFFGVHSGLAMGAIWLFGSEEQKQKWLPPMAKLEKIGAFGLTEPDHGSDSIALETSAVLDGDEYVINGKKRWIGNGTIADVVILNARDEEGNVREFLVEKGTPGFKAVKMEGKMAKRAVWQADLTFENCRIPKANVMPNCKSFKDVGKLLAMTRFGVAWETIGHAMAGYEYALAYSKERKQFGKPIASFQMVQEKLAHMLAEITSMQLMSIRLAQLASKFQMTNGQCSMAKMQNCRKSREIVAMARDIMGGNGVLYEYQVARHFLDMEIVYTYEGTDSIQTLIVGKDITGIQAFR